MNLFNFANAFLIEFVDLYFYLSKTKGNLHLCKRKVNHQDGMVWMIATSDARENITKINL